MAEEEKSKKSEPVEFSSEELEKINELTSYFNRAPGQVEIPDEPVEEEQEDSGESSESDDSSFPSASSESAVDSDLDDLDAEFDDLQSGFQESAQAGDQEIPDLSDLEEQSADDLAEDVPLEEQQPVDDADSFSMDDFDTEDETGTDEATGEEMPGPDDSGEPQSAGSESGEMPDMGGLDDLGDMGDMGDLAEPAADETGADADEGDEMPDMGGLDDLGDLGDMGDLGESAEPAADDTQTDAGESGEMPDMGGLDDLGDLGDLGDMGDSGEPAEPGADEGGEMPDMAGLDDLGDMGDLGEPAEPAADETGADEGGEMPDMGGLDDLGDLDDLGEMDAGEPESSGTTEADNVDDLEGLDLDTGSEPQYDASLDDSSESDSDDDFPPPPSLDALNPEVALSEEQSSQEPASDLDLSSDLSDLTEEHHGSSDDLLSDDEIKQLRAKLRNYAPGVRKAAVDAVIEDKLNDEDTRHFVDRVLADAPEEEVEKFLEAKLGTDVDDTPEVVRKKPRVIVSREQYTDEGAQRQARIIKYGKFAGIAAILLLLIGSGSWFWGIKPYLYNSLIEEGRQLILNKAPQREAVKEAEGLFDEALEYYPQNIDGYLQYADAYRRRGMYRNSFIKLFGDVRIPDSARVIRYEGRELDESENFWPLLKKVPVVTYRDKNKNAITMNNIPFQVATKGAYLIGHLDRNEVNARVLMALGYFHSNPVQRFKTSPYRNNLLGIDYFQRIRNFDVETPVFEGDNFRAKATLGIGDVYYNQGEYYRSLDYFEKIIRNNPQNVAGQTGVLKAMLKIYRSDRDPRLVIQQHSVIKHTLGIEDRLPLFMLARLAGFYIDLPDDEKLRIRYNVSPVDKVNGRRLKTRIPELLDILYAKEETDTYGNTLKGSTYAEGYYQRGRYYRYTEKKTRMAMKQMEYAYRYDPRHFMALNERAEMLIELNDYTGAIEHLKLAMKQITPEKLAALGDQPADETLIEADEARIPFNMGKALYLSVISDLGDTNAYMRISEAEKYSSENDYGIQGLSSMLDEVDRYFEKAADMGLKSPEDRAELSYYSGWSHYVRGNFTRALAEWEHMPLEVSRRYRNLELAKSHSLYKLSLNDEQSRTNYLKAALGYLNFLGDYYRKRAESIARPSSSNKYHLRLFTRMAIIENNIGAIHEMLADEKSALKHYWKSVDYSKRIARENEVAHLNIRLSFKRTGLEEKEMYPVIMDFIPPLLQEEIL